MEDGKKEEASEEELGEAKDLFVEGLGKIVWATGKITRKVIEGFKKGYREADTEEKKE